MSDALLHTMRDPINLAIPFFVLTIVIELTALHVLVDEPSDRFTVRDSVTSMFMGVGALSLGIVFRAVSFLFYVFLYVHVAPWHLPADHWATWVAVFIAVDLLWYTYHRCSHRIRLIWAAHQAHHNSNYFNTSTATRQKWNQWFESLIWIPLPLLGVPPWMVLAFFSFNLIYQFFTHTETIGKLPRAVEFVFNTPSHHRVHHGSDKVYLDRNYGGVLIIWDRLFGTFQPELHRPTYGLTTPIHSNNLLELQFHEYAAIVRDVRGSRSWRSRLGYVFGPPGWVAADRLPDPLDHEPVGADV
ncbi:MULTISPECIES: sterol desaturase family protein [unclassified Nocardioides]|uniref:sterol desaturase family protein n=1 Tax=unclassified Nocardioides TaxID=2615069 RepID=UPI0006F7A012|nr:MULTISPECIES: sterol desaturase family protein [unclassified Nocardioides]KRA32544.1 C-5 sterol desaturase [Nocardioides sp. Root614]KRA89197.1 C-5 sterol desaturase [Nocardioides sp. Root682]